MKDTQLINPTTNQFLNIGAYYINHSDLNKIMIYCDKNKNSDCLIIKNYLEKIYKLQYQTNYTRDNTYMVCLIAPLNFSYKEQQLSSSLQFTASYLRAPSHNFGISNFLNKGTINKTDLYSIYSYFYKVYEDYHLFKEALNNVYNKKIEEYNNIRTQYQKLLDMSGLDIQNLKKNNKDYNKEKNTYKQLGFNHICFLKMSIDKNFDLEKTHVIYETIGQPEQWKILENNSENLFLNNKKYAAILEKGYFYFVEENEFTYVDVREKPIDSAYKADSIEELEHQLKRFNIKKYSIVEIETRVSNIIKTIEPSGVANNVISNFERNNLNNNILDISDQQKSSKPKNLINKI